MEQLFNWKNIEIGIFAFCENNGPLGDKSSAAVGIMCEGNCALRIEIAAAFEVGVSEISVGDR